MQGFESPGVVALSIEQRHWLLEGIDIATVQRHPRRAYTRRGMTARQDSYRPMQS